ncbi:MAG: peptidylprolyl isomerase, partial [Myxococcota bacterium]
MTTILRRSLVAIMTAAFATCVNQSETDTSAAPSTPPPAVAPAAPPPPVTPPPPPPPAPPVAAEPDPHGGTFTIAEATAGLPKKGKLQAVIETTQGTFTCELFEKEAPNTVANFVGLARGLRAFRDLKTGAWVKRPYYDGIIFHRVIPNFMIQGGDPSGTGRDGPGYDIADEF